MSVSTVNCLLNPVLAEVKVIVVVDDGKSPSAEIVENSVDRLRFVAVSTKFSLVPTSVCQVERSGVFPDATVSCVVTTSAPAGAKMTKRRTAAARYEEVLCLVFIFYERKKVRGQPPCKVLVDLFAISVRF